MAEPETTLEENPTRAFARSARETEARLEKEAQDAKRAPAQPPPDKDEPEPQGGPGPGEPHNLPQAGATPAPATKPAETPEEPKWVPKKAADWKAREQQFQEQLAGVLKEKDTLKGQLETQLAATAKERDSIKADIAAAKAELDKIKTAGPPKEVQEMKEELERLREKLRMADLELDDGFKRHFENETNIRI